MPDTNEIDETAREIVADRGAGPEAGGETTVLDAVVVGAGPAGVAVGAALAELGVDFLVVDRDGIGASFRAWPEETRLLTPSFASNSFGQVDLNAVAPRTSPAFSLGREHPDGPAYADYLEGVVDLYEIPVETGVEVTGLERAAPAVDGERSEEDPHGVREGVADHVDGVDHADRVDHATGADSAAETLAVDGGAAARPFALSTTDGPVVADHVVWAAGEFGSPRRDAFTGAAEHGVHYGEVDSWAGFAADHDAVCGAETDADGHDDDAIGEVDDSVLVVGGFESGVDAAVGLVDAGADVVLLDSGDPWNYAHPDPSEALSPFTRERLDRAHQTGRLTLEPGTEVVRVSAIDGGYELRTVSGETYRTRIPPVLATGFEPTLGPAARLFDDGDRGFPALTDADESTTTPGLFLAGPAVTHDAVRFCFVYKFRQRAPVVAATIADRCGVDTAPLDRWRDAGMYLDDLSCCEPDVCDC